MSKDTSAAQWLDDASTSQISNQGTLPMNKLYPDAKAALEGICKDNMVIMAGGFGLCGIPEELINALRDTGVKGITAISNNAGVDGIGLSRLLETRQISKMVCSAIRVRPGRKAPSKMPTGAGAIICRQRRI